MSARCRAHILLTILLLLPFWVLQAQEVHLNGDSMVHDELSPDHLPVFHAALPTINFDMLEYVPIDTHIFHTPQSNPLSEVHNIYQSLGIFSQAHKSMIFDYDHAMGFSMITLPYPLYFRDQRHLRYYNVETSYTKLNYTYGLFTENSFQALHTQRVRQVKFTFDLNGYSNSGYFIHQGTNMFTMNLFAHYETKNGRYGIFGSYLYNHGKYAENGGLSDISTFVEQPSWIVRRRTDEKPHELGSFAVLFSNANTLVNTHDFYMMQYLNIQGKKSGFYYGTLSHTFQFKQAKSLFYDHDLNNDFYRDQYYINTDTTRDTIQYYTIANSLQWSNYRPFDTLSGNNYFVRLAGGVHHEFVNAFMPYHIGNTMSLFARTHIRLFSVWDLFGGISYSFFNYNKNDAHAYARATFAINRKNNHFIGFAADFYRISPDYFFSYYIGNNSLWYNEWPKQDNVKLSAYWTRKNYRVSFNYYMLNHYIFINSNYQPEMAPNAISIIQLQGEAPLRIHNFFLDANLVLQHATKREITVPLFAGKLSAAYCFRIFKRRLNLQIGGDLMFNTTYYADGYNPLLHQFFHQEEVKTGNFVYFDLHLSLRVKRLSFFVRGGNLLAGLYTYNYLTTPNYPMMGQSFRAGINWRFYD